MVDEDADEDGTDDRPECEYGIDCYRNGHLLWKNCSFRYQGEVFHCRENRQHLRDFKHTKKPDAKRRGDASESEDVDDPNDHDYEPEEEDSEEEEVEIVQEAKRAVVRPTSPSPGMPKSDFFCKICNRGCGLRLHKFYQSPP